MKGKLLIALLVLIVGALLLGGHGLEARAQGSRASLDVATEPSATPETENGVDASSARWAALGAYYTGKYEAAAAASSARWTALGAYYTGKYEAAAAASSARYQAMAEWYAQRGLIAANTIASLGSVSAGPTAGSRALKRIVTVFGGYSGDDAYDPAAGGHPEASLPSAARGSAALAVGSDPLATVRQSAAQYQHIEAAEEDGFVPLYECIEHPSDGAMGLHYVNLARFDSKLDPTQPEALVYQPKEDGQLILVAVEFIIPAAAWSEADPPTFLGQTLHYKTTVGPHSVAPYYELHAWVWAHNPSGIFADWNPRVTCPVWAQGAEAG